jgi:hypothetical protein
MLLDCFFVGGSDNICYEKKAECIYYDNKIQCDNAPKPDIVAGYPNGIIC